MQTIKIPEKMTFDRNGNKIQTTYAEVDSREIADVITKSARCQDG